MSFCHLTISELCQTFSQPLRQSALNSHGLPLTRRNKLKHVCMYKHSWTELLVLGRLSLLQIREVANQATWIQTRVASKLLNMHSYLVGPSCQS